MFKSSYKWCAVPQCDNTSKKTPNKLFVTVPRNAEMRKKWLELARRNPEEIMSTSTIYFCEDHFNMEKDMANYLQHKMGFSQRIIMDSGVLPSKFDCQRIPCTVSTSTDTSAETYFKRKKLHLVEEQEPEIEEKTTLSCRQPNFYKSEMGKDVTNFLQHKTGFSQQIIIVNGVLPLKFDYQRNGKRSQCADSTSTTTLTATVPLKDPENSLVHTRESVAEIEHIKIEEHVPEIENNIKIEEHEIECDYSLESNEILQNDERLDKKQLKHLIIDAVDGNVINDCRQFGNLVASKLEFYDESIRFAIQNDIMNIFSNANRGFYDCHAKNCVLSMNETTFS